MDHSVYKAEEMTQKKRYGKRMFFILLFLIITIILSFGFGYYPLTPVEVFKAFTSPFLQQDISQQALTIFWKIRLPRILSAAFIGASLSVAGATYQGMFRNPLVSADVLGVSSGASLGAAIAIFSGCSYLQIQLAAFTGGALAVFLSYHFSKKSSYTPVLSLVICGSIISSLCNALVSMIQYVANPNDVLQQIIFWLMGSLTKVNLSLFYPNAIGMLIGFLIIFAMRWHLNLLTLSDEEAISLGIPVKYLRLVFIFASTLLSSSALCLGGLIGWIGLMVPHITRSLFGANYKRLIPASALCGAVFLVIMDDLSRSFFTMELPLGAVTSVVGAPFVIFLIVKRGRKSYDTNS